MVSLSVVQVGMFAVLACLCAAIYAGLRGQPSLAWLAAALFCGAIGGLILGYGRGYLHQWVTLTVIVPAAYLCLAQAVRIVSRQEFQYRGLILAVGVLTAIAVVLAVADVPFLYQTLPFHLACALAVSESIVRLLRGPRTKLLDICLIVALAGLACIFLVRIPVYLMLFEPGAHYAPIRDSSFQRTSLAVAGFLGPVTAFLLLVKVIGGVIETYRMGAERDPLTGLLNRHGFDLAVAGKKRVSGALILGDIDHFKQVNDRYGHAVGDDVLCAFAQLLANTGHCAGRMGGEEFALFLPHRTTADAARIAGMIGQQFYTGVYPGIAPDHRLSASFGIAELTAGTEPRSAFIRADAALYQAKETGRNRAVVGRDAGGPDLECPLRAA